MKEQTSIPKHKLGRAASLAGAGMKVGVNYLRYKGTKAITGRDEKDKFHERTAADTYKTFSKLKGGPLKLAQMLSMDKNMIPVQYSDEFSKAQYSAPPLSYPLVVKTFQREMGKSPTEIFDTFTNKAAAGASIGQVHKATKDGKTYAVKVQYPGVADSLHSDLAIVKPIAMKLFQLKANELDPYMQEVESKLLEETNYDLELTRSIDLAEKSNQLPLTRFPKYYPDFSSKKILAMEWVDGLQLDKYAESDASQDEKNKIAQALWDFYAHQIHALKVFHADPHPGNFIVKDGELWVLDFGCVKEVSEEFNEKYFRLMEPEVSKDKEKLKSALYDMTLLLEEDDEATVEKLLEIFRESISLLNKPYMAGVFDFGDNGFFEELAAFGERTRNDKELQAINSARGKADALYLNRTFFGVYNLMGMLQATVDTSKEVEHKFSKVC
ncbi:MAG: putative unusual protein kinase regulating ubiquinone biosynthesis (AarF/ABC1/UbiB family) [Cryomorphaceae bacterium]|jgi:predicted unusual protein kinase regulating ubiquinone biosynthesis (AarF/ABC1/UbiB family)